MTLDDFNTAKHLLSEMDKLEKEHNRWHSAYCKYLEKDKADIVTLYTNTCCNPPEIHMRVDEFVQMYFMVTRRIEAEQNRLGAEFDSIGKEPPVVDNEPPKYEAVEPPKDESLDNSEPETKQEYYHAFCSRCGRPVIAKKEEAFWWPGGTTDDHLCISCDVCGGLAEV